MKAAHRTSSIGDHLTKCTSKTVSTRSIKIDEESKKLEITEGNVQSITEMAMEKEFGKMIRRMEKKKIG